MGNIFLTVVGTGLYNECTYCMGEYEYKSRFIQEAVLRILCKQGVRIDKIVCLATKEAREANWEAFTRTKIGFANHKDLKNKEVPENVREYLIQQNLWYDTPEIYKGLKELFGEVYPDAEIKCVEIPMGSNESELLDIFKAMYEAMDREDNVYIDVTHGFRSMPMLYIPVIKYTEAIKNINLKAIYYGAYEVQNIEKKKPIFELSIYKEILDWAFGSQNFIQYGNSKDLLKTSINRADTYNFVKNLNGFTECIQTGRGNELNKKSESIRSKYNELKNFDYDSISFPTLVPLIENIRESISEFAKEGNTALGLATVHWCRDKGMIQQGYTALEETIKSLGCDICGYKECNDYFVRDGLIGRAMICCKKLIKNANVKGEAKIRYYKENQSCFYDMLTEKERKKIKEEGREKEFKRVLEMMPMDLVDFAVKVKDIRNDINHFGMRNDSRNPSKLINDFDKHVAEFDELYNKLTSDN